MKANACTELEWQNTWSLTPGVPPPRALDDEELFIIEG